MKLVQLQIPVIVVCVLSAIVSTFAIVCRLWARVLTKKRLEASDWLMVISYVRTLSPQSGDE
jgi:hypothetical protein